MPIHSSMRHMHTVEDIITEANGTRIKVIAEYGVDNDRIIVTGEVYYERQDNDGYFFDSEPDEYGMVPMASPTHRPSSCRCANR